MACRRHGGGTARSIEKCRHFEIGLAVAFASGYEPRAWVGRLASWVWSLSSPEPFRSVKSVFIRVQIATVRCMRSLCASAPLRLCVKTAMVRCLRVRCLRVLVPSWLRRLYGFATRKVSHWATSPVSKPIATSAAMQEVLRRCDGFAGYDNPVLITGES